MTARKRLVAYAFAGSLAAASSFVATARAADPPKSDPAAAETMREHFRRGVELFDEGDYKLALIEFERAYSVSKSYKILYNIGQVHSQLGQYAKALASLEGYVREGGAAIPDDRRAEVERDLTTLRSRTAMLEVRGSEGAEITFDGEPIGKVPFAALRVNAGDHRIGAKKPGFIAQERRLVLAGGDVAHLDIPLEPEPVQVATKRAPEPRTAAWITWGGAAALGAGAAVTGILALGASSDLETLRNTVGSSAADRKSAADRAQTFSIVSDVLLGATVLTAGAALYLTLKKPSAEPAPAAASRAVRDVRLTFGLGALGASGSF